MQSKKEANKTVSSMEKLKRHELFAVYLNIGTKGDQSKQKEKRIFVQFGSSAVELFAKGFVNVKNVYGVTMHKKWYLVQEIL